MPWELGDDFGLRLRFARKTCPEIFEDIEPEEPTEIEKYIVGRFEGYRHHPIWLDELPLSVALRLCEAAGQEDFRRDGCRCNAISSANARANDGYHRIAASEEHFRETLRKIIINHYPRRKFTVANVFGEFVLKLADVLNHPDYRRVTSVMRDTALEMLPLGPGDDLFGEIYERRFHTVRTAAREFEIPTSMLRAEIAKEDRQATTEQAFKATLFDRRTMESLSRRILERGSTVRELRIRMRRMMDRERLATETAKIRPELSIPVVDTAKVLRTRVNVVWALADEGYIPIFEDPKRSIGWRVPKSDLEAFSARFMSGVEFRELDQKWKRYISPPAERAAAIGLRPAIHRAVVGEDFYDRSQIM
jgi:hypothetical protein